MIKEYIELLLEMPHVDTSDEHVELRRGKKLVVIDFRIEHLPIPQDEKRALLRAFHGTGFVADVDDRSFVFSINSPVRPAGSDDIERLPHLPGGWLETAAIVEE